MEVHEVDFKELVPCTSSDVSLQHFSNPSSLYIAALHSERIANISYSFRIIVFEINRLWNYYLGLPIPQRTWGIHFPQRDEL